MPFAHGRYANLGEQLETRARRVDRGDGRRSVLETPRTRTVVEMLDIECERLFDAPPPDRARPCALRDAATCVEERDARSAHQPLQGAADEVVDSTCGDIEGDRADRLVCVHDQDGAFAMADLRERADVLDPARREIHV